MTFKSLQPTPFCLENSSVKKKMDILMFKQLLSVNLVGIR